MDMLASVRFDCFLFMFIFGVHTFRYIVINFWFLETIIILLQEYNKRLGKKQIKFVKLDVKI